ncbi:DNA topoisomerase III [Sutcliffiella deserti]|uniref:DNA topoisomerase III n=1 Tax=Sutcliffiella deserti TaxID=2875501 RepID=UPI001CC19986|nr:DNA topoisomerase III [Sutcliffiella deserti]
MPKIVVLAEKPSVGRDIARVLKCTKKGNGYLEGDQYIVTWALGHLVTLADPEAYDEKYKAWKLEDLPMLPNEAKLVVIKKTGKQYSAVKAQLTRKDVKEIVIATDAGREGELVARWILEKANIQKPIKRLWISSVTDKAIKTGFQNLRNGKEYENLYYSAVARAEADWVVGMNATRALTTKYNAQLSCGRVQTPTLAMIAKREEEIHSFVPKEFYGMKAITENGFQLLWQDAKTKERRSFHKDLIERIYNQIKNKQASITNITKAEKKSYAPALYDLTELQRDANRIFGYSAKETLSILQRLYEQYKLVTYPRTDSRYLTTDMVETLKERVEAIRAHSYKSVASKLLLKPIKSNKSFINDEKVTDHHAIIPTEETILLSKLSDKEYKIYDLIVKRFLAILMPPFIYEQTTVTANLGTEQFVAKGKTVISQGWKEVFGAVEDQEEGNDGYTDQLLPSLVKGETLSIKKVEITTGKTKPPEPFNEGTLLSAMENPAKFMEQADRDLIKTLGETGGIGTVATRADIIEKLFNSFLMEKRGKGLHITSKGKQLLTLVPEDLKSPALTAEWEQKLGMIAKGKLQKASFINEMKTYAKEIVQEVKNSEQKFRHDNVTGKRCPDCDKPMLEVNGKKGKMLVCQDRECGHRKNVSKVTNARCPKCRKKLELRGEGDGQMFACACGHREKLSTFQERRKKNDSKKASKQDVNQYLKKQNRDEPVNTALADALAKLKLK